MDIGAILTGMQHLSKKGKLIIGLQGSQSLKQIYQYMD
jgi:hypothetical protein